MKEKDINLGQAFTLPDYRGRGILTNILKLIGAYYNQRGCDVWGYCNEINDASQKAFDRSGYKFVSYAKMSTLTRIVEKI